MAAQTEQKVSGGLACYCEATFACPCITKIMAEKKLEKLFAAEEEDLKWSRIAQKVGGSVEKKELVSEKEETCSGCEGCYFEPTLACPIIAKRMGYVAEEETCKGCDGCSGGIYAPTYKCPDIAKKMEPYMAAAQRAAEEWDGYAPPMCVKCKTEITDPEWLTKGFCSTNCMESLKSRGPFDYYCQCGTKIRDATYKEYNACSHRCLVRYVDLLYEPICECGEVKSNDGTNTGYFSYCAKCCAEAADEAFRKDVEGEDDGSGWRGE